MAQQHTPGPWSFYDDSNDGKTNRIEIVAIGKTVARIYHSVPAEDLSNAHLIAAAPAAAPAWQPIETAPKDGTAILISDGRFSNCVEWSQEFDWWSVDDNKLGPFRLRGPAPTHWMPLPAAPGFPSPATAPGSDA